MLTSLSPHLPLRLQDVAAHGRAAARAPGAAARLQVAAEEARKAPASGAIIDALSPHCRNAAQEEMRTQKAQEKKRQAAERPPVVHIHEPGESCVDDPSLCRSLPRPQVGKLNQRLQRSMSA